MPSSRQQNVTTTSCLTADMLEVGMRCEARTSFTRAQVEQYCALSGDDNAIHRNLEAAQLRFPGVNDVIVPGGLIQMSITDIFGSRFPGEGTLGLTFTPKYMPKPVCPQRVMARSEQRADSLTISEDDSRKGA
jgi:acyl dehydratase